MVIIIIIWSIVCIRRGRERERESEIQIVRDREIEQKNIVLNY